MAKEKKYKKEEYIEESDKSNLLSFDVYFQGLIQKNKALSHHKAPMRKYAEDLGVEEGTKEEFDSIFKRY